MIFAHKSFASVAAVLFCNLAWSQTQDCRSVLNGVLGNADKIQITVSALHINGALGSAEGVLGKTIPGDAAGAYRLSGQLAEYFSDRLKNGHPGDPSTADKLQIEVPPTPNFQVRFTLLSWGNVTYTLIPTCDYDMMYGFGGPPGHVRDVFYTVKFLPAP
jgi:hypothetical protein